MTKKGIVATLLAISLAAPAIMSAAAPVVSAADTPEITVVGKRITGDDNYFEISLEVNGDYEDYSAVGVVLEYDPNYIIPAESWEDEAGKADMSAADSWSTRLALPTYGDPSWTTRTALTYIAKETSTDPATGDPVTTQGKGYLYLGAEYPGKQPNTTDPDAAADPASDPAADPTASDDDEEPHSKPIVAARFVYKGEGADAKALTAARKAVKADLISKWTTGNWDKDWKNNTILTVAPDAIAEKSPAQYPFAIYGADFSERVYMNSFPTAATTTTVDPTATRAPYTAPATGSAITDENKLAASKLEIVTCEGKSAKSGGLELDDVFAIIFLDWDNSIIGVLSAATGAKNMAETVNKYVNDKLVHEDLRMDKQNYENLVSSGDYLKRKFSYRGEYPYDGPHGSTPYLPDGYNAVTNGEQYPLTNKLDYVFAGKEINPELPFANGWVQVATKDIDYSAKPGNWAKILPKNMDKTFPWWQIEGNKTFQRAPELDDDGNLVNSTDTIPDVVLYDFDNITEEDLEYGDGNLYVKAAYDKGELLNIGASTSLQQREYKAIGDENGKVQYGTVGVPTATLTTYSASFQYRRINLYGHGVERIISPSINMAMTQNNATASTPLEVKLSNGEVIDVLLTPTNAVKQVGYFLTETNNSNIVIGVVRSALSTDELGDIKISGVDGIGFKMNAESVLTSAKNKASGIWFTAAAATALYLSSNANGADYANNNISRRAQTPLQTLVATAISKGENYLDISWYQMQYAILNTASPYASDTDARNWIANNAPKLLDKIK